jgi:hypothetical protein
MTKRCMSLYIYQSVLRFINVNLIHTIKNEPCVPIVVFSVIVIYHWFPQGLIGVKLLYHDHWICTKDIGT